MEAAIGDGKPVLILPTEVKQMLGPNDSDKDDDVDYYIGDDGLARSTASETIAANQTREGDLSRGTSGGCGQDSEKVPK